MATPDQRDTPRRNPDGSIWVPFTSGQDEDGTMWDGGPATFRPEDPEWAPLDLWLKDIEAAAQSRGPASP